MTPEKSRPDSLQPYAYCPMGSPDECAFGDKPQIALEGVAGPFERAEVFVCGKCGHGVTRPPIADAGVLYEGRDSQDYQTKDGLIEAAIKSYVFGNQARRVLRQARFSGGNVIDFACGSGVLTSAMAAALPAGSRMTALDFFEEPPRPMPKVDYKSFASLPELENSADLLTCFHVLEHDDDPQKFFDQWMKLLKPGGTLVVEVPNIASPWAKKFGKAWDNWYLPYHRTHFSRQSFRALIERQGLEILRECDVHLPSFGRTAARALGLSYTLPLFLAGAVTHPVQWVGEKLSGEPSALRIIARR